MESLWGLIACDEDDDDDDDLLPVVSQSACVCLFSFIFHMCTRDNILSEKNCKLESNQLNDAKVCCFFAIMCVDYLVMLF